MCLVAANVVLPHCSAPQLAGLEGSLPGGGEIGKRKNGSGKEKQEREGRKYARNIISSYGLGCRLLLLLNTIV